MRRYHYAEFCISHDCGREAYELFMQQAIVDEPGRFDVINKTQGWTKDGEHMVGVEYVEDDGREEY